MLANAGICQDVPARKTLRKDGTSDHNADLTVEQLMKVWRQRNDQSVGSNFAKQNLDRQSPFFGGFPNQHRLYFVGSTAQIAKSMVAAYVDPLSSHHRAERLAVAVNRAATFIGNMQHEDGTIDLISTNFHSPPDTGFVVDPLATSLRLIRRLQPDAVPEFQEQIKTFLTRAGNALAVGGVHTPNHRWVVCRALALLNSLMANKKYVKRIDRWLLEGIDIDPDGQYTEQSVAGYTPLVNRCLIAVARLLDRDELLAPVRKNLNMSRYYLHANGELVTDASNRQDKYRVALPTAYYYSYRYMALKDRDPGFAGMARQIESIVGPDRLAGELVAFMDDPFLHRKLPAATAPPTNYVKPFLHSGLVRIRRDEMDATILAGNDRFFTFFKGEAALQAVRFASAFFGKGQFVGKRIDRHDGCFKLTQELTGPYFQPSPEDRIVGDGDWAKLPKADRAQSEVMQLQSNVTVNEESGGFRIDFDVSGTDRVPAAIELAFRTGGSLSGVKELAADRFLLEEGYGTYRMGNDDIRFGPGRNAHEWTQLRGAKPKLDGQSVYITGYTPFKFQLRIS